MDNDLMRRVRALHGEGKSTNEMARVLGVPRGEIAPLVRALKRDLRRHRHETPAEDGVVGCWVSPGWSVGLTVETDRRWPDREAPDAGASGMAAVLVARERPGRDDRFSVCGFLVDTYCLGVKDAFGPRSVSRRRLDALRDQFFGAFDGRPIEAPVDLARHLVWGAVEYARGLGFDPHRDFRTAQRHLEPLTAPSAIRFGCDGKPYYIQGPYDDADRVMRTLRRRLGDDGHHFLVGVPLGTR